MDDVSSYQEKNELDAVMVLAEMYADSSEYYYYNLGRQTVLVTSHLVIPQLDMFSYSLLEHEESRVLEIEAILRQWFYPGFIVAKFWPLQWVPTRVKFKRSENAHLAWLLLAMDYPRRLAAKRNLRSFWKIVAALLGLPVKGADFGKKIRNHVREILILGPKQPLTEAEESELITLIEEYSDSSTGPIPWTVVAGKMAATFGKPFGGGRLKDDWHNFIRPARIRSKKRKLDDGSSLIITLSINSVVQRAKKRRLE